MKMNKKAVSLTLAAAMALSLAGCGGSSSSTAASGSTAGSGDASGSTEPIVFKLSHTFMSNQPMHEALTQVAQNIEERTNGQIKIEVYEDCQIAYGVDGVEQCLAGANFINVYDVSCLADWVPDLSALCGPYLCRSQEEFSALCDSETIQALADEAYAAGVKVLDMDYCFGMRQLATSKKAVRSLDDLKNLKLRVPNSSLWIESFTQLGASPVAASWSEIYNGLQTGVYEGMESSLSDIADSKLYEVCPYITLTNHMVGSSAIMLSAQVWDSLTPEQQQIMEEEFSAGAELNNQLFDEANEAARTTMEEYGVEFIEVDPAPFEEAAAGFYTSYPGLSEDIYDRLQAELETIRAAG